MATPGRPRKTTDSPLATFSSREAQRIFGELLSRVGFGRERILITRHGKKVAVLVSLQDLEQLDDVA